MSDGQPQPQPELRWAPLPPKPKRAWKVWTIAGIVVVALIVSIIVLFVLLNPGGEPDVEGTASPTPSVSVSPSPSEPPTVEPTDEPTVPAVTEPPVVDPSVEAFREQVSVWLESAPTGLDIVSQSSGQDALTVVDTLQEDAQRLSDAQPPSSILEQWYSGVSAYAETLGALRTAVTSGSGVPAAVESARVAVQDLNAIVGL